MTSADKTLYHQIHPAKLATDILSSAVSCWLFWHHLFAAGLAAALVPPVIATFIVMRWASLDRYARTPFGRYLRRNMTVSRQVQRLFGFGLMAAGFWYHSLLPEVFGASLILHAWFHGLLV